MVHFIDSCIQKSACICRRQPRKNANSRRSRHSQPVRIQTDRRSETLLLVVNDFVLLDDQCALYIGLVGQDTFPAAVLPPQDVGLDLFARKGLMFERAREREMKGYGRDVAVDTYSGIRQVRFVGLSREGARLDRSADAFPVVESALPSTTDQSGSSKRQTPSASLIRIACASSFSAASAFSLVGPSLVWPAARLQYGPRTSCGGNEQSPMINMALPLVIRIVCFSLSFCDSLVRETKRAATSVLKTYSVQSLRNRHKQLRLQLTLRCRPRVIKVVLYAELGPQRYLLRCQRLEDAVESRPDMRIGSS